MCISRDPVKVPEKLESHFLLLLLLLEKEVCTSQFSVHRSCTAALLNAAEVRREENIRPPAGPLPYIRWECRCIKKEVSPLSELENKIIRSLFFSPVRL